MKQITHTKGHGRLLRSAAILSAMIMGFSCAEQKPAAQIDVRVANELDFARNEVVSVPVNELSSFLGQGNQDHLRIKKEGTDSYLRTQWLDADGDSAPDELLFQAAVEADSVSRFIIVYDSTRAPVESDVRAYSRFVPERTDDYTWENDKVAFRTYGPTGQKEALEGVPGSTLSSGIDLWLKRTDVSVIDKWYAEHLKEPGYYHIDHGEGYDPYHVGGSRGTGGLGVWANDSLYVSQNFTEYKTIADGPLRTVFEFKYAPWGPYEVRETKRISLDLGSNFSKFEVDLQAADTPPNYAVGLTLHENEGTTEMNDENGWFAHWEVIDSTQVGEGIVMDPSEIDSAFVHKSDVPDQSHILILAKPDGALTYYAGFAWEKSGQVKTKEDWLRMLQQQAVRIKSPLEVSIDKNDR